MRLSVIFYFIMSNIKIHFVISPTEYAQKFGAACIRKWGNYHIFEATHVVSLGGDGTALFARREMLSAYLTTGHLLPIYDVDCSDTLQNPFHVGALMNPPLEHIDELVPRIKRAKPTTQYPLQADYHLVAEYNGITEQTVFGFNEIYLKAAIFKMVRLHLDVLSEQHRLKKEIDLSGDGVIIATPSGQNAYYKNACGHPFTDGKLGIQGISTGAGHNYIISDRDCVNIQVLSRHSPTYVLHDNSKPSQAVSDAFVYRSKIPVTILKDFARQRD